MKVAIVSREIAPFFGAGIGTYAANMARAWAAAGHEAHVFTPPHPDLLDRAPRELPGVTVHVVDETAGHAAWDAYRFGFFRHAMAVYEAVRKAHDRHGFDYIEFPDYWGEGYFVLRARQTLAQLTRPVIGVRLHTPTADVRALNREATLDEEFAWLEHCEEEAIRAADVLVSPTRSLLEIVRRRVLDGRACPPGEVVPYPFDVASVGGAVSGAALARRATDAASPAPVGGPARVNGAAHTPVPIAPEETARDPVVLYYGRIEHRKGVQTLVRAAVAMLDRGVRARFRFIGGDTHTGPFGRWLRVHLQRSIPAKHRYRFEFLPPRPRAELVGEIASAAVCCFPSLWENFPNTCLEAMSLGAVVVGSDAGGMGEIIEPGRSGLLFRAGDEADLARALEEGLSLGARASEIGAAARARIASYCDPASVVTRTAAVVERIAAARAATRVDGPRAAEAGGTRDAEGAAPIEGAAGGLPPAALGSGPAVSVVVPFYNLARYAPETLGSIRAQTCKDLEIVLVDDGSTAEDACEFVAQVEDGRFGPVRVVRKANGGLSSARNAGIAASRGRWVLPVDADDLIDRTLVEKSLAFMRRTRDHVGVTALLAYFHEGRHHPHGGWVPLGFERDIMACTNCASSCTALMDRQAILDLGGYDEWLTSFEDWDLYCRMATAGMSMAVIPEFLIHYRIRPDSMVRTEGVDKRASIKAYLMAKHPGLARRPDRALRLQLSASGHAAAGGASVSGLGSMEIAQSIINENIRYRVADRVNVVLKKAGLQRAIKGLWTRVAGEEAASR